MTTTTQAPAETIEIGTEYRESGPAGYYLTHRAIAHGDGRPPCPSELIEEYYQRGGYVRTALCERHPTEEGARQAAQSLADWLRSKLARGGSVVHVR